MAFFRGGLLLSVESNRLVIKEAVGEGAFGQVFKVKDQEDGQLYALKVIHTKENSPRASRGAIREVKTLRKVNHDHILEIFGADKFKSDRSEGLYVLILTEFCSGGNLNERLSRRSSHEKNLKWMKQLASALRYLHDEDIVHRDLKPENVLLTSRRQEDIKIGDFGLAREYLALKHVEISDWLSFYNTYYMGTAAGTYPYIAPEVFSQHYTEEADVFSLGCIFYAILKRDFITGNHGKRLYGAFVSVRGRGKLGLGEAMSIHPNRNYMVEFDTTENTTRKLMNRATLDALQCDPNDRPSADNISYGMELISSANSPDEDLSLLFW